MPGAEGDNLADRGQLVPNLFDHGEELLTDEQDFRFGVVDDVQHLRRR